MSRGRGYDARTQVLLTRDQRERLERQAVERGVSVGALIREAIDRQLPPRTRPRSEALEAIKRLHLPVGDWSDMEAEIIGGALR
ncbi:MAG: CopG family transcriptional regulator [Actinomycetota bacterium]